MNYKVNLLWDSEANVWVATSDDIQGLVLESNSYDALIEKVKTAVYELLELNGQLSDAKTINFISERKEAVA